MNVPVEDRLQVRIHGNSSLPTLVYLPGLHGDWTLANSLRHALSNKVRFVEFTYPRTLSWSLHAYSDAIDQTLTDNGLTSGWLLAESFGSQVMWPLASKSQHRQSGFHVRGVILAGGFVKHPNAPGIRLARNIIADLPNRLFGACIQSYAAYARFRHRHAPETLASIHEFVQRRSPVDRRAMAHRLDLLAANDARRIVQELTIPVYALSGFWDPIVPRLLTRIWLKQNCPGYREGNTIFTADHNVLGTQPKRAAEIILKWMNVSE